MRYRKLYWIAFAGVVLLSCVSALANTIPFPFVRSGIGNGVGDFIVDDVDFFQGWYLGQTAWYILWDGSNDIRTNAWIRYRTLFPKLGSAIGHGANRIYVVLNNNQGPVFSEMPGPTGNYSGLWQVVYITWYTTATKRIITSHLNLPGPAEALQTVTNIVVDRPIIAVGPLGGPWWPAPPGSYRLRQVVDYDLADREVEMSAWAAYAQDKLTQFRYIAFLIIPDVADPDLAALLHANVAPGLDLVDPDNTQMFWVQDWTSAPYPPPGQLPVIENLPNYAGNFGRLNDNYDFTPIMDLQRYTRNTLAPYVVIKTPTFLEMLIPPAGNAIQPSAPPVRINAPVFYYLDPFHM